MPFDGRWFYGDALFVIDPWFWLVARRRRVPDVLYVARLARVRWTRVLRAGVGVDLRERRARAADVGRALGRRRRGARRARWWLRDAPPVVLERAAQAGIAVAAPSTSSSWSASSAAARADVRAAVAAHGIVARGRHGRAGAGRSVRRRSRRHDARRVLRRDASTGSRRRACGSTTSASRGRAASRYELAAQAPDGAQVSRVVAVSRPIEVEPTPDGGTLVRFSDMRYRGRIGPYARADGATLSDGGRRRAAATRRSLVLELARRHVLDAVGPLHLGPDVHARLELPAGRRLLERVLVAAFPVHDVAAVVRVVRDRQQRRDRVRARRRRRDRRD